MQDQNANEKSSTNILWGIAGVFALILLVWYLAGDILRVWFINFRLAEIKLISIFTDRLDVLEEQVANLDPNLLDWNMASYISEVVGGYLGIPLAILLGSLAAYVYFKHAGLRFTKKYDMEQLFNQEKVNWPQICPVAKLDLAKEDIDSGPWAMSQTPLIFCKRNDLIDIELIPDPASMWKREPIAKLTVIEDKARRVFARQLGPHFNGVEGLPIYIKALFAAFACRINRDAKTSDKLLSQIALTAETGKPDFSGVEKVLNKYHNTNLVQKIIHHHAYVYTVMASMLATARCDGVLPVSDFLWIKPIDRRLYYILNSIGRQVAFPEAGGIFAHWKTELEMGRPLNTPFIEEAVQALDIAMTEILYTPTDEEMQELMKERQK